ncbi:hypothetical protein EDC05_004729 [Coemansia umbellata]|nr:hypothetical protein EDC05_004729 [Coemansia umbellata]
MEMDASPLLGLITSPNPVVAKRASKPAPKNTRLYIEIASNKAVEPPKLFSPLVRDQEAPVFSLTIGSQFTVEDLARTIESAQGLDIKALFKGNRPLMFTDRICNVLQPNDTVVVYSNLVTSEDSGSNDEAMMKCADLVSKAPLKARFINILITPALLRAFLGFCALPSELALESLLFVLDVERFRHAPPSMARLLANYIYLSYIAPVAPLRINISGRMRDRVPWPFLPNWDYNPWLFDEILASIGFTLKKHTLLRFERSPVGLVALMQRGFNHEDYIRPLNMDSDPMAAIARYEPNIDVVIWVNELEFDAVGTQMLTNLSKLTTGFREKLLERILAQFVNEHHAYCLSSGYFRLATQLVPLQKQRKIKKTRKLCSFFGDNPNEALLRQQLMAVVPPSSHLMAARAAAELVARKQVAEAQRREVCGLNRQDSVDSSVLAERRLMEADSDSDVEQEHEGWAERAMKHRSFDSLDGECQRAELCQRTTDNGWTSGDNSPLANPRRGKEKHPGAYNDQTMDRALSMIGMPNSDTQSNNSSASSSPRELPKAREQDVPMSHVRFMAAGIPSSGYRRKQRLNQSYSVYSTHGTAYNSADGRSNGPPLSTEGKGSVIFERKKRVDKLREFFGRSDPVNPLDYFQQRDSQGSVRSTSTSVDTESIEPHLTPAQRQLLVRRRRKLKALLGEQVDEQIIGLSPSVSFDSLGTQLESVGSFCPLPSNGPTEQDSLRNAKIRQYSKIREVLGESAPVPSLYLGAKEPALLAEQILAQRRRTKLEAMLGGVPENLTTFYKTDADRTQAKKNSAYLSDASSDGERQAYESIRQQRMQCLEQTGGSEHLAKIGGSINGSCLPASPSDSDDSYEFVPLKSPCIQKATLPQPALVEQKNPSSAQTRGWRLTLTKPVNTSSPLTPVEPSNSSWEVAHPAPIAEDVISISEADNPSPVRAQFWMTSSPESQASVVASERANKRTSLMATLRASKANIIGSLKRATPSTASVNLTQQHPGRPRASSQSSNSSVGSKRRSNINPKLGFLSKIAKPSALTDKKKINPPVIPPMRASSIKPLSPLPPISPNNFEASFDRGMALREVVAVAEYISSRAESPKQLNLPPRVSSAKKQHANVYYPHQHMIASALLSSNMQSTRQRKHPSSKAPSKTVHWFDSPNMHGKGRASSSSEESTYSNNYYPETPLNSAHTSPQASAKSSMELGMAIVLRSPSMKKPSIKSPIVCPKQADPMGFPKLPVGLPQVPQMALAHKASISAVGGRRIEKILKADKPCTNPNVYSNIVTIRARRTQSFAIQRRLERATVGRKRSNTIGTGRQAETHTKTNNDPDAFPRAEKPSRRVQSMITAAQMTGECKLSRNRCVTVIPLRLELQRLLTRKLSKTSNVTRQFHIEGSEMATLRKISELLNATDERSGGGPTCRSQYIRMTSDALCAMSPQSTLQDKPESSGQGSLDTQRVCHPYKRHSCVLDYQQSEVEVSQTGAQIKCNSRFRSKSCPGRYSRKKDLPISPKISRYLSSAKASSPRQCGSFTFGPSSTSGYPYQRISLALLSRPPMGRAQASNGRRSLDTRPARGTYSPYTAASIRRYASISGPTHTRLLPKPAQ